jgi:hypothetical protein
MTVERISPFHNSDFPERQVQEALKHPVMWRALLGLDRDSIHARIAGGETEALHLLSRQFIVLFHWKLTRRVHGYFRNLSTDVLIEILRAIAQHTDGTSTHSRDRDWNEPASQSNHLSPVDAMQLYYEALSGGIITEDARHQWRWRHSIVYNYLISDRQVGE